MLNWTALSVATDAHKTRYVSGVASRSSSSTDVLSVYYSPLGLLLVDGHVARRCVSLIRGRARIVDIPRSARVRHEGLPAAVRVAPASVPFGHEGKLVRIRLAAGKRERRPAGARVGRVEERDARGVRFVLCSVLYARTAQAERRRLGGWTLKAGNDEEACAWAVAHSSVCRGSSRRPP